jgi:ABC-type polysaccharide/polyol phosphate export permease
MRSSGAPGALTGIANSAMLVVMVWLWLRLLPTWALVADGRSGAMATLRECFALTRGHTGRLLALAVVAAVAALVVGAATLFAGGAVLMVIGRAISGPPLGVLLVSILLAVLVAVATTIWTVMVAFLYRQLGTARSA